MNQEHTILKLKFLKATKIWVQPKVNNNELGSDFIGTSAPSKPFLWANKHENIPPSW